MKLATVANSRRGQLGVQQLLRRDVSTVSSMPVNTQQSTTAVTEDRQHKAIVTPVLIVGAGPVGATLSALLGQLAVPHVLVDRRASIETIAEATPHAHLLSNRTMEVFRSLHHFDKEVYGQAPPLCDWRFTSYTTGLNIKDKWKHLLAVKDHFADLRTTDQSYIDPHSPCPVTLLAQNKLVPLLLEHSKKFFNFKDISGAFNSDSSFESNTGEASSVRDHSDVKQIFLNAQHGHLLMGYEWLGGFTGALEVESWLRSPHTGEEIYCQSGLVIGTDGQNSAVRRCVLETEGARMEKIGSRADDIVKVAFQSKELAKLLHEQNRGMLHFVITSKAVGLIVVYDLKEGIFAGHFPYYSDHQSFEKMFNEKATLAKLHAIVGKRLSDIKLQSIRSWKIESMLSSSWRDVSTGRVLIAGDAAHVMPPTGGLGMNCGIADAFNLAWKLGFIYHNLCSRFADSSNLRGTPIDLKSSRILSSYAAERYYAAQYILQVARGNLLLHKEFLKWFGIRLKLADKLSSGIVKIHKYLQLTLHLRLSILRYIADTIFGLIVSVIPRLVMIQTLVYPYWLSMQCTANKMAQSRSQKLLSLLPWGADLGYAYRNSPLNPQVSNAVAYVRASSSPVVYNPPTWKGCRIPHIYLLAMNADKTVLLSTVDLPFMRAPAIAFCLVIWDSNTLRSILLALHRSVKNALAKSQRLQQTDKEIITVFCSGDKKTSALGDDGNSVEEKAKKEKESKEILQQILAKLFVVHWADPRLIPHNSAERDSDLMGQDPAVYKHQSKCVPTPSFIQLDAAEAANVIGPDEVKTQLPELNIRPRSVDDANVLGRSIHRASAGDGTASQLSENISEQIDSDGIESSLDEERDLDGVKIDLRHVWSNLNTLECFKQSIRIPKLLDSALLLRPDAHIAAMCESKQDIESFVDEITKLPLTD